MSACIIDNMKELFSDVPNLKWGAVTAYNLNYLERAWNLEMRF